MSYELFMDGFDYYATADITKKWNYYDGRMVAIHETAGRRGGGAMYMGDNIGYGFNEGMPILRSVILPPAPKMVVGFALKYYLGGSFSTFWLKSNEGYQFALVISGTTGQFTAYTASGSEISTYALPSAAYCYVEIGVNLSDTGSYEIRVNGQTILANASVDTTRVASSGLSHFEVTNQAGSPGTKYIDDFYITYGDEIKFLGDSRVDTLALTANSTPQDWTPDTGNAWERLNQDAGYISGRYTGESSLFTLGNLGFSPAVVHGVQLNGHAAKSAAGPKTMALQAKSGGTVATGAAYGLSTDTQLICQPFILNPVTGAPWGGTEIDDLEVGAVVTP